MNKKIVFDLGNTVEWESQAAGYSKTKRGKIVVVLPAGKILDARFGIRGLGAPRNHQSYLVQVGKKFYWPRVSYLRRIRK